MSGEELGAGASCRSGVRIRLLKRAVPPPIDYLAWRGASKEDVRPEEGAVEGEACARCKMRVEWQMAERAVHEGGDGM